MHQPLFMRTLSQLKGGLQIALRMLKCNYVLMICMPLRTNLWHIFVLYKIIWSLCCLTQEFFWGRWCSYWCCGYMTLFAIYFCLLILFLLPFILSSTVHIKSYLKNYILLQSCVTSHQHLNKMWLSSAPFEPPKILSLKVWLSLDILVLACLIALYVCLIYIMLILLYAIYAVLWCTPRMWSMLLHK